jgi:hypothetical protein
MLNRTKYRFCRKLVYIRMTHLINLARLGSIACPIEYKKLKSAPKSDEHRKTNAMYTTRTYGFSMIVYCAAQFPVLSCLLA